MTALAAHDSGRDVFSHDLLLHDSDLALVQRDPGVRAAGTRLRRPGPRAQHGEPGGHAAQRPWARTPG